MAILLSLCEKIIYCDVSRQYMTTAEATSWKAVVATDYGSIAVFFGKFNTCCNAIHSRINIISNEANEPSGFTIAVHPEKNSLLSLFLSLSCILALCDTCLRTYLSYLPWFSASVVGCCETRFESGIDVDCFSSLAVG